MQLIGRQSLKPCTLAPGYTRARETTVAQQIPSEGNRTNGLGAISDETVSGAVETVRGSLRSPPVQQQRYDLGRDLKHIGHAHTSGGITQEQRDRAVQLVLNRFEQRT
jgi:hypothetical protein